MKLKSFLKDRAGNFALTTALLSPILFGLIGFAVDYSIFFSQKSRMQDAADSAALAAVREASLQGWSKSTADAVVEAFVSEALSSSGITSAVYSSSVGIDKDNRTVTVRIRQDGHGYFLLGMFKDNPQIGVTSTAALAGTTNICTLALSQNGSRSLDLQNASLTADKCGVFANSTKTDAIDLNSKSKITAAVICSAGGYRGDASSFAPEPLTDCPVIDDPLAERSPPSFGKCDYQNKRINIGLTIRPGVYCGGLTISGVSTIYAQPGIYVIKNGPLEIEDAAILVGDNVGFYLTGTTAKTKIGPDTTISLSAPKDGAMAGILFFEDRNSKDDREFEISSKNAQRLVGTIYLPNGTLISKGKSLFGTSSEWTAIIARNIRVANGVSLKLNSDYDSSDVPVPTGIAGTERIYLSR